MKYIYLVLIAVVIFLIGVTVAGAKFNYNIDTKIAEVGSRRNLTTVYTFEHGSTTCYVAQSQFSGASLSCVR